MFAQLTVFSGPRSPELVAASERAGFERIEPLLDAHPVVKADLVSRHLLRQPDGGEAVLITVGHESTLDLIAELVMSSELLPGENPALLPGPDRVERYSVVDARGPGVVS